MRGHRGIGGGIGTNEASNVLMSSREDGYLPTEMQFTRSSIRSYRNNNLVNKSTLLSQSLNLEGLISI